MSVRIPLIVVAAALLVAACDKDSRVPAFAAKKEPAPAAASAPATPPVAPPASLPETKTAEVRPDCCCNCPQQATAPARPAVKKARVVQARKEHRARPEHRGYREYRERRYADTRPVRAAGASVSVQERETYSERYLGTVEEGYGYSRGGGGGGGGYDYDRRKERYERRGEGYERRTEGYQRREGYSQGQGHGYRDGGRYGYREESYREGGHGYREGYRRGYDYGDYDRSRPPPPQARPYDYPLAGRDRDGYLQWPAKVGH